MTEQEYAQSIEDYLLYKTDSHIVPVNMSVGTKVKITKQVFAKLGLTWDKDAGQTP